MAHSAIDIQSLGKVIQIIYGNATADALESVKKVADFSIPLAKKNLTENCETLYEDLSNRCERMKIPNCSDNLREGLKIHCERTSDSPACSHMTLYIIIACVGVVLLIGIIGGVWYYRRRRAAKRNGGSQSTTVSTETGSMATGGTTGTKGSTVKSTGRF